MKKPMLKSKTFYLAIAFLVIALILRFALIGYSTMALIFAGLSCLCLVFLLLRAMKNQRLATVLRRTLWVLLSGGVLLLAVIVTPIVIASKGDADPKADYLIVLGAGVTGSTPSLTLVNRLSAALDYLNSYPDAVAIVSGGQGPGEDISEAVAMRIWLLNQDLDPERIIVEDKSTSTRENIKNSLLLVPDEASVAIVSNDYHLYRAKNIAAELDKDVKLVAAKTPLPLLTVNYYIREAVAVTYAKFFG